MASVDFDVDDYLDEASTGALRAELSSRDESKAGAGKALVAVGNVQFWTPSGLADDLRTAFYARNASRFEMLLTALQPHVPTKGLHQTARGTA